jgi:hypothetical protein
VSAGSKLSHRVAIVRQIK